MENLLPCTFCKKQPILTQEGLYAVFSCTKHGHVAMGANMQVAHKNWNKYITFFSQNTAKSAMVQDVGLTEYCQRCEQVFHSTTVIESGNYKFECPNCLFKRAI